jgi:hypothetical protein
MKKLLGALALPFLAVAALVVPSVRRYLKIKRM